MTMAPQLAEPETIVLNIAGRRIHVACWGDGNAPPLLLIHGMRDHARSWDWVAAELADRYRIYAPDLRGHGNSDWTALSGYTLAEYGLDIADTVEALGLERFAIAGHSFGGQLALRYAACWPERVTALSGIECVELPIVRDERTEAIPFPQRMRTWMELVRGSRDRQGRTYASVAEAQARMQREQPQVDEQTIAHVARHAVYTNSDGSVRWKFDQATRLRPPDDADATDLDQMLAAVACPVLLFYGTQSYVPMPPPERLALLADHRIVTIPGGTHWLHHEERETYIAELTAFFDAHKAGNHRA